MKLEHIEYFCQITPGLSLNVLSEKMHISQQNLSQSVKLLENHLGCKLLNKSPRNGVSFTKEGEEFLFYSKQYLNKLKEIKNTANPLQGKLTIAIRPSAISSWIDNSIAKFMEENPAVTIDFIYSSSVSKCIEMVKNNIVDFYIGNFFAPKNYSDINILNQYNLQFVLCSKAISVIECRNDLLKDMHHLVRFKDLKQFPCIIYSQNTDISHGGSDVDYLLKEVECASPVIYEHNKTIYYTRLAKQNVYGLALVDAYTKEPFLPTPDNIIHIIPKEKVFNLCGYIINNETPLSPEASRFLETINIF